MLSWLLPSYMLGQHPCLSFAERAKLLSYSLAHTAEVASSKPSRKTLRMGFFYSPAHFKG